MHRKYISIKYKIETLDPGKIIDYHLVNNVKDNLELKYSIDFSKGHMDKSNVLLSTGFYDENALFYQMRQVFNIDGTQNQESDLLSDRLFYLDFNNLFYHVKDVKEKFDFKKLVSEKISNFTSESISNVNSNVKLYFLFKNGFDVKFNDSVVRTFVPFESSASMSRECKITFVDKDIKDEINERLMLGLDLTLGSVDRDSYIRVKPHKYFAYRGLYMSNGKRVEEASEKGFVLNPSKVVVIDDDVFDYRKKEKVEQITAPIKPDDTGRWKISKEWKNIVINAFDGEGLISPRYAEYINEYLGCIDATSYQVRMPFVKGMLHSVDFHDFLREYGYMAENEAYYVKDLFGIERDLQKAEIILTKSMLKNNDWLKAFCEKSKDENMDPMKIYFDGFQKYDHALYIAKTDKNLHNAEGIIKINYQYLNTLNLTSEDFRSLVSSHIEFVKEIANNPNKQREILLGKHPRKNEETWKVALSKNTDFLKDSYIKSKITAKLESYIEDIYSGNLIVVGENRFLSSDLLALLIHIIRLRQKVVKDTALGQEMNELKKQTLRSAKFYMPSNNIKLDSKKQYAFLRNPHLSRNEECALMPYIPGKVDRIYKKYFGKLQGVLMVSRESLVPMMLGGADFDGDFVKIISNEIIVKAVNSRKEENKVLISIPGASESAEAVPEGIKYEHVKDSYGNQVGHISNMAIKLGVDEYAGSNENSFDAQGNHIRYTPADCTLLTGLEIDAAKTGLHPVREIEDIEKQIKEKNIDLDYLAVKKDLDGLDGRYVQKKKTKDKFSVEKDGCIYYKAGKKEKNIKVVNHMKEEYAHIEKLPFYYMKAKYIDEVDKVEASKKTGKANYLSFKKGHWKKEVESQEAYQYLKTVYVLYSYYKDRYKFVIRAIKEIKKNSWKGRIITILKKQYDSLYDEYKNKKSIMDIFSMVRESLETYVLGGQDCYGNLETSLKKIESLEWIYKTQEQRKDSLYEILPEGFMFLKYKDLCESFLCNFSESGYMILYYVIKDVLAENLSAELFEEKLDDNKEKITKPHEIVKEHSYYKEIKEKFEKVYGACLRDKVLATDFNNKILNQYKDLIGNCIDNYEIDLCDAQKMIYAINNTSFWTVFTAEQLEQGDAFIVGKEYQQWKNSKDSYDTYIEEEFEHA